jgi:hypothetical protein
VNLAIMALRLAARAALAPAWSRQSGIWPTLAGERVFDSRFDMVDARAGERSPLIVMGVEDHAGDAFSGQDGAQGPRGLDGLARLVFSLQITSRRAVTMRDPQTGLDETFDVEEADLLDHELADMLAILGEQVKRTLDADPVFRKVCRRITKTDENPYPDGETGEKISILAVSLYVEPLSDGVAALALIRDMLPEDQPERARAVSALANVALTDSFLAAAKLRRSGVPAQAPFAASISAQGHPASAPPPAPPSSPQGLPATLDPPA